jgi:hypothetical protein
MIGLSGCYLPDGIDATFASLRSLSLTGCRVELGADLSGNRVCGTLAAAASS